MQHRTLYAHVVAPSKISADDVVDVAERLVDADGLGALSVRRLAGELGVSRQIVYTHFSGMHDVLNALHVRSGQQLTTSVEGLSEPSGTDERLVAAAHGYVASARERPAMFELAFGQPVPGYIPSAATTAALRAVFQEHIVGLIDEWSQANGTSLRRAAIVERTRLFWSAIHGLVTLERAGHATLDETDALIDQMIVSLMSGWRAAE